MKRAAGFTLLEMVVAIAILAGMFMVAMETFRAASDGRENLPPKPPGWKQGSAR